VRERVAHLRRELGDELGERAPLERLAVAEQLASARR
jgi:hypothetical protein